MSTSKKTMEYKGFKARIMEADRLTGDYTHGLPPGNPLDVYPSDIFVEYPEQWMKGPEVFVVPVRANKGLWFDWTMNSKINTAVVPTVKGCNPITGLQTSGINLERYEEKCPKHGVKFEGDRYCPKCDYKWPPQNYVSVSPLWWDGWRSEDGSVRQFFFTEDDIRDVATHMIGKENTVPAFGFAFFQPKEMRQEPETTYRSINITNNSSSWGYFVNPNDTYKLHGHSYTGDSSADNVTFSNTSGFTPESLVAKKKSYKKKGINQVYCCAVSPASGEVKTSATVTPDSFSEKTLLRSISVEEPKEVKEVSIGAGAKIAQGLDLDPYALDTWRDKPSASMVIYFVFQEKLDQMLSKGVKDLNGKKEGMLDGLPVG